MPKVTGPLFSLKARGQFAKRFIFKRGGIVVNYFKPRNPKSAAQQAQREAFKEFSVPSLTQEQADLLYAAIAHLHDDRYSQLGHAHNDLYSLLSHLHDDRYSQLGHNHDSAYVAVGASDPFTQYFNQTRGDARYALSSHAHAGAGYCVTKLDLSGRVNTTTLADDPELQITGLQGNKYISGSMWLRFTCTSTTPDGKLDLAGDFSAGEFHSIQAPVAVGSNPPQSLGSVLTPYAFASANGTFSFMLNFVVSMSNVSSGTIKLRYAQNTSNAAQLYLLPGSFLRVNNYP